MPTPSLHSALAERPYPGRGCLAARTTRGDVLLAYFLTGRSAASQERELRLLDNGDVLVADGRAAGSPDDLRHYVALTSEDAWTVLGNGTQVEPIATDLADGLDFATAWSRHDYEPDPPINTPRIWLTVDEDRNLTFGAALHDGAGGTQRPEWPVVLDGPGSGWLLTTYTGTVDDVRTSSEPVAVQIAARDGNSLIDELWSALNPAVRVAAFVTSSGSDRADWQQRSQQGIDRSM